jgi:hemoglobin-like flavoprotein
MTSQQIDLVRQTWRPLRDVDPMLLGDVFYRRLFMQYPQVRSLFKEPMEAQYRKFVDMLNVIVARIDRPAEVMPEIADMGHRHEGYGTLPEHYAAVGEALLWTLEQALGKQWTPHVQQAWKACYEELTQLMLEHV